MIVKEYNALEDIKELDNNKIIFLVGAGVSIASPSNLPSGKRLTEYYLESCIGLELAVELMQRWKKINEIVYSVNKIHSSLLRLEFIIGCINDVDYEFYDVPFIAGFQQFARVNSNINHTYLGALLRNGCKVITPNFDCAIENTFSDYKETIKLGVPTCIVENNLGSVYHYHGIGTQYSQLGATIIRIKKGLPYELKKQLLEWFQEGYSIISVGFSCSDYFDMTPFFESLPNDTYNGSAIFFQHGNEVEVETKEKVEKFYHAFKNRKLIYGDTSTFLKDLCAYMGISGFVSSYVDVCEWQYCFENIKKRYKKEKMFYLIRLLNQSGLNLSTEVFVRYSEDELIGQFKSMDQLLESAMSKLDTIDVENHIIRLEDRSKSIFSDIIDLCRKNGYSSERFSNIEGDFNKVTLRNGVRKEAKAIEYEKLVSHIEVCKLEPQNFVTKYVYAYVRICKEKIRNVLAQGDILTDNVQISQLYNCACKMLMLPFNEYEYISYYISIMKMKNLLSIMLKIDNNITQQENRMLDIALEICGVSLIINIYFNTALQYIMLFLLEKEWDYFDRAQKRLLIAKKCIDETSNYQLLESWNNTKKIFELVRRNFEEYGEVNPARLVELLK